MKHIIAILLTAIISCATALAADSPLKFSEKKHDFGVIKYENGVVKHQFEFVNISKQPVIILRAKASCGCTVANPPKHPIAPGKQGKIDVAFSPDVNQKGEFRKNISVTYMVGKKKKTEDLQITGVVIPKKK